MFSAHGITKEAVEAKSVRPPYMPDVPEINVESANSEEDEEHIPYTGKIDFSSF